ncbi:coiled-coil domain-containing protein 86-like [Dysidea avara]|uniref:coiled-coil domain-containing protein 86-like n=1 Tax=Dysidea avara TaxID=196820 RepID=UPI003320E0B7
MTKSVRGRPKSGRMWRKPGTKSFSRVKVPALKQSFKEKQTKKVVMKAMKEHEKQLKENAAHEKQEKRLKEEERKKRKEENTKKSEIVQTITNAKKLKRLKKKQLRNVEKR